MAGWDRFSCLEYRRGVCQSRLFPPFFYPGRLTLLSSEVLEADHRCLWLPLTQNCYVFTLIKLTGSKVGIMCGRYALTQDEYDPELLDLLKGLRVPPKPRYNIAPSQQVLVLMEDDQGRRIEEYRWGLVPFWAKDVTVGYKLINARSETLSESPAFRNEWKKGRRCMVLADGFYEWQRREGGKGPKIPYWIHMADERPFGFAGLWARWDRGEGPLYTCTILTTRANELVGSIHDRMPVVLGESSEWNSWLNPEASSEELDSLLRPYPEEEMHLHPVSPFVNKPGNEGPECISPVILDHQGDGDLDLFSDR